MALNFARRPWGDRGVRGAAEAAPAKHRGTDVRLSARLTGASRENVGPCVSASLLSLHLFFTCENTCYKMVAKQMLSDAITPCLCLLPQRTYPFLSLEKLQSKSSRPLPYCDVLLCY